MLRLPDQSLDRHLYVIGGTGVGKSRALESWFMQLAHQGKGVGVIDPHDELFNNLVARLAARRDPQLFERVVIVDPTDQQVTVGFNPLELHPGEKVERKAQFLADVISKIWRADPLITARMQRLMLHTFWLLSSAGLTLLELPPVLTNESFRQSLLTAFPLTSPLRQYWELEFPTSPKLVAEWSQSTLNKAGMLAIDSDLSLLFGQVKSTIDFRAILDRGLILLVKLAKGVLNRDNSYLLGAFIMAQIQQAALARADSPEVAKRQFTLFVDEFQNYVTDNIQEALAESRKYRLALVMAHQFYEQLADNRELQAAVINTVGNLVCFRLGDADARQFVRDIFLPPVDQVKDVRVRMVGGVEQADKVYRGLNEIWEQETRRLTTLADREFWYKRRGPYLPRRLRSLDMSNVPSTSQLAEAQAELRAISARQWARPKTEVQREITQRREQLFFQASPPRDSDQVWGN